jgi:hypothetical protein
MPRTAPVDVQDRLYENWFTSHELAYRSELLAVGISEGEDKWKISAVHAWSRVGGTRRAQGITR